MTSSKQCEMFPIKTYLPVRANKSQISWRCFYSFRHLTFPYSPFFDYPIICSFLTPELWISLCHLTVPYVLKRFKTKNSDRLFPIRYYLLPIYYAGVHIHPTTNNTEAIFLLQFAGKWPKAIYKTGYSLYCSFKHLCIFTQYYNAG